MISKKYRLTEREVKKVLQRGKPFFSYGVVLNYSKNKLGNNRFSIVLGAKSVTNNVTRNYFRRKFFDLVKDSISGGSYDLVFVVKKKTKFDKNDINSIVSFEKDIKFLLSKI